MTLINDKIRHFFDRWENWLYHLSPKVIVGSAFGLILAELLIFLIVNPVFYRDSTEYYAMTEAFRIGLYDRAFLPHLPVLYTVFAGMLAKCGVPVSTAQLLVSGIFTALTVFPVYFLLRGCQLTTRQSAWGCLIFALMSRIIRCGCAPLLDSGRFFFMLSALAIIFNASKKFSWKRSVGLGIACAGLTLVRGEGLFLSFVALFIGFLQLCHILPLRDFKGFLQITGRVLLPFFIMIALCTPRLVQMYRVTGIPVVDYRQFNAVRGFCRFASSKIAPQNPAMPGERMENPRRNLLTNNHRFLKNFFKTLQVSLFFILCGMAVLTRRKKWNFSHFLLLFAFLCNISFLFLLQAGAHRYLLINDCFLLPFTITGLTWLLEFCRKQGHYWDDLLIISLSVAVVSLIVHSMGNLRKKENHCFQTAAAEFAPGKPLASTTRSGQRRPVVLLICKDCGFGCFGHLNTVYDCYGKNLVPEKVIAEGVEPCFAFHWVEPVVPSRVQIDAIAVWKDQWKPSPELSKRLRVFRGPEFGCLTIYQVQ